MFGHESKPSRIWSFKARPPHEGGGLVTEQLRLAHRYRNALVALARHKHEDTEAALLRYRPRLGTLFGLASSLSEAFSAAEDSVKARSVAGRRRDVLRGDERKAHAELRRAKEGAWAAYRRERSAAFRVPAVRSELDAIDAAFYSGWRAARGVAVNEWGLYWGTYLPAEAAFNQSLKPPGAGKDDASVSAKENIRKRWGPPEFRRRLRGEEFVGHEGAVTVQLQGGLDWYAAKLGNDTKLRILPVPAGLTPTTVTRPAFTRAERDRIKRLRREASLVRKELGRLGTPADPGGGDIDGRRSKLVAWGHSVRGEIARIRAGATLRTTPLPPPDPGSKRSRAGRRAEVWVRVGSRGPAGREPAWARAVAYIDREPPPGTVIKWVHLRRTLAGRSARWSVQFVLSRDSWDAETAAAGAAGVDVNWWMTPVGLRVATAAGSDGSVSHLFVPNDVVDAWRKHESLQSIRSVNADAARAHLLAFRSSGVRLPGWFREASAYAHAWKGGAKLAELVWAWKGRRFPGDAVVYARLEAWRKQDRHLHDWHGAQHDKVRRIRNDLYRKWARGLARRFRLGALKDTNYAAVRRAAPAGEEDKGFTRLYSGIASPGLLSRYLREAFAECAELPANNVTRECHGCGMVNAFDQARVRFHACQGCGASWDVDENAARNLLRRAAGARREAI